MGHDHLYVVSTPQSMAKVWKTDIQIFGLSKSRFSREMIWCLQVQILGHDHLDVASTLQNIAQVLKHKNLQESWEKYQSSLAVIVSFRCVSMTVAALLLPL